MKIFYEVVEHIQLKNFYDPAASPHPSVTSVVGAAANSSEDDMTQILDNPESCRY